MIKGYGFPIVVTTMLTCAASAQVYPTGPHDDFDLIPFGAGGAGLMPTHHQVYDAALFGATPVGLSVPVVGGGGAPNNTGPMPVFFAQTSVAFPVVVGGPDNFEFVFTGTPFTFDPAQGRNLLIEIEILNHLGTTASVSRAAGGPQSSRAYSGIVSPATSTTALRTKFSLGLACYPDCDGDTILTLADFGCFQTKFGLGDLYADCDGDALLTLADFGCFQTKFGLGCP
jgi:hypothetical protein